MKNFLKYYLKVQSILAQNLIKETHSFTANSNGFYTRKNCFACELEFKISTIEKKHSNERMP